MQQIENSLNLLHCIGRSGLLAVTKSGVGDHKFISRVNGDKLVVKINPAHFTVRKNLSLQIRFRNILEPVDPKFSVLML